VCATTKKENAEEATVYTRRAAPRSAALPARKTDTLARPSPHPRLPNLLVNPPPPPPRSTVVVVESRSEILPICLDRARRQRLRFSGNTSGGHRRRVLLTTRLARQRKIRDFRLTPESNVSCHYRMWPARPS